MSKEKDELGFTETQRAVLNTLSTRTSGTTSSSLSRILRITLSSADRAVKKLEQSGYITGRKDELIDKREIIYTLTDYGKTIVAQLQANS